MDWAKKNIWKWTLIVVLITFLFLTTPLSFVFAKVAGTLRARSSTTKTDTNADAVATKVTN